MQAGYGGGGVMDIRDLDLRHTVLNLISAAICLTIAALVHEPWMGAFGLGVAFGAVAAMIVFGEITSRPRRPASQGHRRSQRVGRLR